MQVDSEIQQQVKDLQTNFWIVKDLEPLFANREKDREKSDITKTYINKKKKNLV